MAVSILDAVTQDAAGVPATITVSAGSNRGLFICIGKVFGTVYTTVTYGGQSMTLVDSGFAGDAGAEVWWLNEAGIAAAGSTTVATTGGSGTVGSHYFTVQDADQTTVASNSATSTGTSGTVSLARVADSVTGFLVYHDVNNASTLGNPSGAGFNFGAGRLDFGTQTDTANTSDSTWSNAFNRDNASIAFNIGAASTSETATTGNIPLVIQAGYTKVDLVDPVTTNASTLFGAVGTPVTGDDEEYTVTSTLDANVLLGVAATGVWTVTETVEGAWVTDITVSRRVVQADGTIGTEAVVTLSAATGLTTFTSMVTPMVSNMISNMIN